MWRTRVIESWNTLAQDLVEKGEFIKNSSILNCILALSLISRK